MKMFAAPSDISPNEHTTNLQQITYISSLQTDWQNYHQPVEIEQGHRKGFP